jgi:uncharacterized membrane protein
MEIGMEIIVLRLIHIVGGIFWVGSALFTTFFLLPALAQAGPATGPVMAGLQRRGLMKALPLAALLTIVSGLRLMWITSAGFTPAYFGTPVGRAYTLAGLAAIVGFLLAILVARPAAARAAQLAGGQGAGNDTSAEIERLRRRAAVFGSAITFLLLAAAAGMAVARYL